MVRHEPDWLIAISVDEADFADRGILGCGHLKIRQNVHQL